MAVLRYLAGVSTLRLEDGKCRGCGLCREVCPHDVFGSRPGSGGDRRSRRLHGMRCLRPQLSGRGHWRHAGRGLRPGHPARLAERRPAVLRLRRRAHLLLTSGRPRPTERFADAA